jgi:hypothetical protein
MNGRPIAARRIVLESRPGRAVGIHDTLLDAGIFAVRFLRWSYWTASKGLA